jgi:hypothetical protein
MSDLDPHAVMLAREQAVVDELRRKEAGCAAESAIADLECDAELTRAETSTTDLPTHWDDTLRSNAAGPGGWDRYLTARSDGVTATVNAVLLRGLVQSAIAEAIYPWQLLIAGGEDAPGYATTLTLESAASLMKEMEQMYQETGASEERAWLARLFADGKLAEGSSIAVDVPAFIRAQGNP